MRAHSDLQTRMRNDDAIATSAYSAEQGELFKLREVGAWQRPATPVHAPATTLPAIRSAARPMRTTATILMTDAAALAAVVLLSEIVVGPHESLIAAWLPAILMLVCSALFGSYTRPGLSASAQISRMAYALVLAYASTLVVAWPSAIHAGLLLISGVVSFGLLLMSRAILHSSAAKRGWYGWPTVVLAEHPDDAARTAKGLLLHPELGLKPVAVMLRQESEQTSIEGLRVLSGPEAVEMLHQRHQVGYAVHLSPGLHKLSLLRVKTATPDFVKMTFCRHMAALIGVHAHLPRVRRCWMKRSMDVVLTSVGLVVAMPIMVMAAILIRLDSSGSALFLQKRPGRDGRPFRILKFRSMCCDAARQHSQLSAEMKREFEKFGKIQRDPRVTRIGLILRKTSIDELPQLFNVLKADMSLVGPRPHLMFQRAQLVAHHRAALKAQPGLTGLWQISGRSSIPFETRLAMDVYYAQVGDLWLDLYILARTVIVVLGGKGAY